MTTPDERTRAVVDTRWFLEHLSRSNAVPDGVRDTARRLLRHYPGNAHINAAAETWPMRWAPADKRSEGN